MRIAVVTPYFKESAEVLRKCMASVQAQCVPVDHVLVADGHPQYWLEEHRHVTHIELRKNFGDFGDTPRSVGFVVAMRSGYDLIQFLDADNVLMPDHFDVVLDHFRGLPEAEYPDLVVARRHMLRPDGSILPFSVREDDALEHIDTSCYVFFRTAFFAGLKWSLIPRQLGFMDDRVFLAMLSRSGLRKFVVNQSKTVGYTCWWADVYRVVGEEPPPNCKNIEGHRAAALEWWRTLDPYRKGLIERTLGQPIFVSRATNAAAQ
jgi:glycosyltransferase involved in cell wall biosynthesis